MYLDLIKRKIGTILVIFFIFFTGAILFTVIRPFEYRGQAKVIVFQNFPNGADPYTISKSNQYITSVLAEALPSYSMFENVVKSGYRVDRSYFSKQGKASEEMKKWKKSVEARTVNNAGTIEISVFNEDKDQAKQITYAIIFALKTENQEYFNFKDGVAVKTINSPVVSDYPVRPNILLNFCLTMIMALVFSSAYIYLFPEEKYNLKIIPKKKRKENRKQEDILQIKDIGLFKDRDVKDIRNYDNGEEKIKSADIGNNDIGNKNTRNENKGSADIKYYDIKKDNKNEKINGDMNNVL
jgi:capsular polysaccharide biosynthesis protein